MQAYYVVHSQVQAFQVGILDDLGRYSRWSSLLGKPNSYVGSLLTQVTQASSLGHLGLLVGTLAYQVGSLLTSILSLNLQVNCLGLRLPYLLRYLGKIRRQGLFHQATLRQIGGTHLHYIPIYLPTYLGGQKNKPYLSREVGRKVNFDF